MRILRGPLRGKKWIAGAHIHSCWLGSYESDKQKLFEGVIKEGETVFDIGANAGFYSMLASVLVGARGRVCAFEPLPRNVRLLSEHLRINQLANVQVIEAAVSDVDGETYFDDSPGNAMGHLSDVGTLRVQTITIDHWVAQNLLPIPHCLKIDVEGAELLVLAGARLTIEKHQPKIFLATHGAAQHEGCCEFLRSLRYRLESIDGRLVDECDELIALPNNDRS